MVDLSSFSSEICFVSLTQLRGRSGRQGDPGSSRFFLSLEDNIFRIFGGDRIQVTVCIYNLFILLENNRLNVVAIQLLGYDESIQGGRLTYRIQDAY